MTGIDEKLVFGFYERSHNKSLPSAKRCKGADSCLIPKNTVCETERGLVTEGDVGFKLNKSSYADIEDGVSDLEGVEKKL